MSKKRISKSRKLMIYERDKNTCYICKNVFEYAQLTIDHVLELAIGGSNLDHNLKTCCSACNCDKNKKFCKIYYSLIQRMK